MSGASDAAATTPDAKREAQKSYADALFGLAATDMHGAVIIAQAALVLYSDGWRLVARFDGLDYRVRMTGYCIDPMTVLENCGVVNARAERAETALADLRLQNASKQPWAANVQLNDQVVKLTARADRADADNVRLRETLAEIAKGEGPFSRNPLTHAANTIQAMQELARAALASISDPQPAAEGER